MEAPMETIRRAVVIHQEVVIPKVTVPMMTVPDRRITEMILPVTVIQGIIMMRIPAVMIRMIHTK